MSNDINIYALNEIENANFQYQILFQYFSNSIKKKSLKSDIEEIAKIWFNYNPILINNALYDLGYGVAIDEFKIGKSSEMIKQELIKNGFENDLTIEIINRLTKTINKANSKISKTYSLSYGIGGIVIGVLFVSSFIPNSWLHNEDVKLIITAIIYMIGGLIKYLTNRSMRSEAKKEIGL